MTTRSIGGGSRLAVSPKKAWPQSPPFLSKSGDHPTQFFAVCGGLWQAIWIRNRPSSLKQDDAGTLLKTGSIGGVTSVTLPESFTDRGAPPAPRPLTADVLTDLSALVSEGDRKLVSE